MASKLDINDVHPNMFAVNNVDDVRQIIKALVPKMCLFVIFIFVQMGVKLNSGQLEITDIELVLHRRGKQPVKWPLRLYFQVDIDIALCSDFISNPGPGT